MARYNSLSSTTVISAGGDLVSPLRGSTLITFTGTGPYTINMPSPALFPGFQNQFYNTSGGAVTLSTVNAGTGVFSGQLGGANTTAIPNLALVTVVSDGTNYIGWFDANGPVAASTLSASSTVTLSPSGASVAISPTGGLTISPTTTAGTINNTSIGQTTAAAGTFTALSATGTTTLAAITEVLNTKSGATGTVIHDYSTGDVWYHSSISASFTVNLTNTPTTTGRSITVTLILAQGGTPYIPNGFQINGTGYTINWPGGVTPSGRANKIDIATFIIVNPSGTFSVLGQYGSFG
jgi:hypothetical protein